MGDSTNLSEKLKSLLCKMQAQNKVRLVQLEVRMEARIAQLEAQMQIMFCHLQNFLSNPHDNCNKDLDIGGTSNNFSFPNKGI